MYTILFILRQLRCLGPKGYHRLTNLSEQPRVIREARARYEEDDESANEHD